MSSREPSGEEDRDELTRTGGEAELPQPIAPEPEPEPKPVRTGSIAPPSAPQPDRLRVPEPAERGLLDRIRRKLGR